MPLFPFYHEIDPKERLQNGEMSDEHRKLRDWDQEDSRYMRDYRRNTGWDAKAIRGMKIYNVVQTMKPTDEVSRIFFGGTRTIIDKGIEQMTEGEPDFSFEPFGPSDHIKTIIWKHLIKKVLSDCQYKLHQEMFFRDYFVLGSGVFEVYIDYPRRTLRIKDDKGNFESVQAPDYRRARVGVRAVNPMNCWRNPNIDDSTQVPSCLRRRIITWNQFAQEFGRCEPNPYINLDLIAKGSHVCLYRYEDEIRDVLRYYAKSFGTESDGHASTPTDDDLGILIFDTSLKIHEEVKDGVVLRSTGLNIPGLCSLRWGTFFDSYDKGYDGQHCPYGMGLPQRIEGEDTALQTIFNMNLDNYRWSQTVALNYKGANADSYIDVDANRLYGAELIDGEITPMPLGIARIDDTQAMVEMFDKQTIPATGVNHQQMVGDTSKTAFEFAQRIRLANRGAEQRLQRLENEVFRPVGSLLLANSLTVLTVQDYEEMTEEDVKTAREAIKAGKKPLSDYKNLNSKKKDKKPERKRVQYIPLKGEKMREDFTTTKTRKLNYNETDNTLVIDKDMKVETSYIPLVKEYVYPAEYIECGMLPDCIVDSKRMLGDMKNQDAQNFKTATDFLVQLASVLGYQNLDLDKLAAETLEFASIDPKRVLKTDEEGSEKLTQVKDLLGKLQQMELNQQPLSAQPNAQVPQPMAAPANAGATIPQPGGQGTPQNALQATAGGAL